MKQHILFINESTDDLDQFTDALRELPHDDGFKCTYASHPSQALEMLKYLVPDYIFFDMKMPGMNAFDLLTAIRDDVKLRNVKAYLYSATISEETYNDLMACGATGWIEKTNSLEKLIVKLRIFIGARLHPAL